MDSIDEHLIRLPRKSPPDRFLAKVRKQIRVERQFAHMRASSVPSTQADRMAPFGEQTWNQESGVGTLAELFPASLEEPCQTLPRKKKALRRSMWLPPDWLGVEAPD